MSFLCVAMFTNKMTFGWGYVYKQGDLWMHHGIVCKLGCIQIMYPEDDPSKSNIRLKYVLFQAMWLTVPEEPRQFL